MLKMLKTGLPENKDYLDTILGETIVSNISESNREWTITTDKIDLSDSHRAEYENVFRGNHTKGSETLYTALTQYIHNNVNYVNIFYDQLDILEKDNQKVLIYTKSKNEANDVFRSIRNTCITPKNKINRVTRYPDKSGTHTVLSFSEGTYGLNDLIVYDTILMRPPEPDKLPQIKGRLDRPGQISKKLYIKYVVLKDTVEEASLMRLELCNNFYNNYLMPLAEFYDLAAKVSRDKIHLDKAKKNVMAINKLKLCKS
jgi:hypothetical protein